MVARPYGTVQGGSEIAAFWQLRDCGCHAIEFLDMKIGLLDEHSSIITAGWKVDAAIGWIHKELWVARDDGQLKLRVKDFGMAVDPSPISQARIFTAATATKQILAS